MSMSNKSWNLPTQKELDDTRSYFAKVFQRMALALAISWFVAYYVSWMHDIVRILFSDKLYFYLFFGVELAIIRKLSGNLKTLSLRETKIMFVLFSVLEWAFLSVIFLIFRLSSIASIFGSTALLFAVMGLYGFYTKKDLTNIGNISLMGLIGIIIGSCINRFLQSETTDFVITIIGVLVFVWLTAYDIQKLKNINTQWDEWTDNESKEAIAWALGLYLDFVNLFLRLLKLFGKRK